MMMNNYLHFYKIRPFPFEAFKRKKETGAEIESDIFCWRISLSQKENNVDIVSKGETIQQRT